MTDDIKPTLSRRGLLAATAGAAIGSGAITGFPTIWAQTIKDIELKQAGQPVTAIQAIGDQSQKDLGFKVTMMEHAGAPATAARSSGAWAMSPSGTPSWTRTAT